MEEVKVLCNENFRTLLKEIEEYIQEKKAILSLWIGMMNIAKMFTASKMIYSFNTNLTVIINPERVDLMGFDTTMETGHVCDRQSRLCYCQWEDLNMGSAIPQAEFLD